MKIIFLSVFFLFLAISLNAQKFEYTKTEKYVAVENKNLNLLLKPYKDKGKMTERYELKNSRKMKEWFD